MEQARELSRRRSLVRGGRGLSSFLVQAAKKIPVGYLVNKAIDALPVELHIPGGYQYCGPGTKLKKRLSRNDPGINKLDQACKEHDIAYSKYSDSANRSIADRALAEKAWQRVKSGDASFSERAAALAVAAAMKAKTAVGGGRRKKGQRKNSKTNKRGGNIKRKRNTNKKKKLWSMTRSGKGLYLRPYKGGAH